MLSKRVIVVAPDKPLQKRLGAAAMAAGAGVQAFASVAELPGELEADLVLCALSDATGDAAFMSWLGRLSEDTRVIPLLPSALLARMVAILGHPRLAAVLMTEDASAQVIS